MKRIAIALCLLMGACSEADVTSVTETTVVATTTSASENEPATTAEEDADVSVSVVGEYLPLAEERHSEVDPVLGTIAPTLSLGDVAVPSTRPTLVLTVVGSCADCVEATTNLTLMAEDFDAAAVLLTSVEPTDPIADPWVVIVDGQAAAAFGGRDRPTALVIGTDGAVLSRIRPFNRSGATYDEADLRFGLQVATNRMSNDQVGLAHDVIVEDRSGQLPETFFAVTASGGVSQVSTDNGAVINEVPSLGLESDGFNSAIPIPGTAAILIDLCCEPAAGHIARYENWGEIAANPFETAAFAGWAVDVSTDGSEAVFSGYSRWVSPVEVDAQRIELGASNGSAPDVAWLRDRLGVVYLHRGRTPAVAEIIELDSNRQPITRWAFELAGPAISVDVNADGNLVVVASSFGSDPSASGEVYNIDTGELLAEFALEDGTTAIDYDTTGRFLAYVDGEGIARWQGGGSSGVLGDGLRTVNW